MRGLQKLTCYHALLSMAIGIGSCLADAFCYFKHQNRKKQGEIVSGDRMGRAPQQKKLSLRRIACFIIEDFACPTLFIFANILP